MKQQAATRFHKENLLNITINVFNALLLNRENKMNKNETLSLMSAHYQIHLKAKYLFSFVNFFKRRR